MARGIRNLSFAGALALLAACTVSKADKQPALTGPSELGTSIIVQVIPDTIVQDGASQSLVTITARDANGQPLRNVTLRTEIVVGGATTDFGSLSARTVVTDANGRAGVTYTAPPPPAIFVDNGTVVSISVTPTGSDFANSVAKFADIRLVPPGVIGAPPSPLRPTINLPAATVGNLANFSATVVDAAGNDALNSVALFSWNFGDGDTGLGRNVSHTYDSPGNFPVTLTITDALGRAAQTTSTLTVGPGQLPTASFLASPTSPGVGQAVNFNASASTAEPGHTITTYSWNFGDGTVQDTGALTSHSYAQAGAYTVTLKTTDDVGRKSALATQQVTVGTGGPTAAFTFSPSPPSTNQQVNFNASASTATSGRSIVSYAWDFDDGGTGSGVTTSHTYGIARTYSVRLTVTDSAGLTGTTTQPVPVGSGNPTAAFTFSPTSPLTGTQISFDASNSRATAGRTIVSYSWNWDDGSPFGTGVQTTHTYNSPGTYNVLLTVTDDTGQIGQISRPVTVGNGNPTASFTFSPTSPFANQAVNFDGRPSFAAPGRSISSFSWTWGDGTPTSTGSTQTHTFTTPGTYVVRLTVTDNTGLTGTTTQNVVVASDAPTVTFTFSTPTAAPSTVAFNATATAVAGRTIVSYAWTFGDGGVGVGQAPTHLYATAGTRNVTVTVTDSAGRTNSVTLPVTIP